MRSGLVVLVSSVAFAAVVAPALVAQEKKPAAAAAPKAVRDVDLSLYPGSVFEVPHPAGFKPEQADPGERERLPRDFAGSPPRIPHAIADMEPIRLKDVACMACHDKGSEMAPAVPVSHLTDLRRSPDKAGSELVPARALCTSCHVPLTSAAPLRKSTFRTP